MTKLSDLPYPLRLCTELLHYAGALCPQTQNMKASEIKDAVRVFFSDEIIEEASGILSGRQPPPPPPTTTQVWLVKDHLGTTRYELEAESAQVAIAKAALIMGTSSSALGHWYAEPKL